MSDYQGIFLRSYIGQDTGVVGTSWNASTDIIVSGTTVSKDPQSIISSFDTAPVCGDLVLNKANYIYVRGKKTSYTGATARIWLYYVESQNALSTMQWKTDEIMSEGKKKNYIDVDTSGTGDVVMTETPFVWSPPQISSGNPADYYCLIAMVENNPDPDPSKWRKPEAFKNGKFFASLDDLGSKILENHNVAWRNTTTVQPTSSYTWQKVCPVKITESSTFIGAECTNMPADSYFDFEVAGTTAANTIIMPKLQIISPNLRVGNIVNMPVGFNTSMTITYYQGETKTSGADINPAVLPLKLV